MKKFLPLLLLTMTLAACNPSQMAVDDLQKFTERIENKSDNWSDADWDDALMHFAEISQTLDRYEYSDEQKLEIAKLKGRCKVQFAKHSFDNMNDEMLNAIIEFGGTLEGVFDGLFK